ncbi:hypothetical protein J2Z47_002442 [Cohnella thailandensis]|uniref:SMEK domain-containing protein n=2 Tax=Cohnella thailandensis TaxID=557557 RepID=A0A841T6C2_9BACL|nr:SMEK domain-containing protein [Cohnella thailandensis]MBP1974214.1 hypothetical protein [Cohnella thailandensis]
MSIFKYYIELSNDVGDTDINKRSEDFFSGLLNLLFNLNLMNMNKIKMNFPAIDLGDKERRICYQITADSTSGKIQETLYKFRNLKLYEEFDEINILIIGNKIKTRKRRFEYPEFQFNTTDNLLELNDLFKEMAKKNTSELEKILHFFESEFGNNIINLIKSVEEDKSLYIDETILRDRHVCYYAFGLGRVRLDAYIPVNFEQSLSCLILFQQPGLSDCMITLEEDSIRDLLFYGDNDSDEIEKRNFIWYIDGDKIGIKLPNNRFVTDSETVKQFCEIITRFHKNYLKVREELLSIIGATKFVEEQPGEFRILRAPKYIWESMVDFAQKHDHYWGETKWDIFHPLNLHKKDRIIMYKNHLSEIKADILAELHVKDLGSNYVDIIWKSGFTPSQSKMEGFNNLIKWRVDYTHHWIVEDFIPYLFYLDYLRNRGLLKTLFRKKKTYEKFKCEFSSQNYGIESLEFY